MSSTVYLYRAHCIEENIDITEWGTSPPTLCPNDHSNRELDPNSISIVNTISQQQFTALENSDGWYQATSFVMDIPAGATGTVYTKDTSWPADIIIWQTDIYTDNTIDGTGDVIDLIAAPDTIIGAITVGANIGDTVLNMSPTVFGILTRGIDITITDGTNRNELGYVISINIINNTVTVQNPLTNNFAPGSLIYLNIHTIRHLYVNKLVNRYNFGKKGFKGKIVPANTCLRLCYTNTTGTAKTIACKVEVYISG
jgi:hypothetical protein